MSPALLVLLPSLSFSLTCSLAHSVVVCSIARLPHVLLISKNSDVTYTEAILGIWSIVEINLGIICGTSMRLKPFIVTYLPKLNVFSSKQRSTERSYAPWKDVLSKADKGQHAYQLHSIQQGSKEPVSSYGSNSRNIHVHEEITVFVDGDTRSRRHQSADDSSVELV